MVLKLKAGKHEVAEEKVELLRSLYDRGLYLQAHQVLLTLPPVLEWGGIEAPLLVSRLVHNLGTPQLAHVLQARAWRESPAHPEALYFRASCIGSRRGPLAMLAFLDRYPASEATSTEQADLLSLRARAAGQLRDFATADYLMSEALSLSQRSYLYVERASLHIVQDQYELAVAASREAISLSPWSRPAVQVLAQSLSLRGEDDEAIALLWEACSKLESFAVAGQLASMLVEAGRHAEVLPLWNRVRELAPMFDRESLEWWHGRMSDACYQCGDLTKAGEHAAKAGKGFFARLAETLAAPIAEARSVRLDVPFVRQHHMTCAPATLAALSRFWKLPVDHVALAAEICYDGTPSHVERHWAEQNGWLAREFRVTWDVARELLDRGVPFTLTTVETESAHLQAVIGYDSFRGTLLIRDPYLRQAGEVTAEPFLEQYAANGPRGMVLVPRSEAALLEGVVLPEALLYDHYYKLQRSLHLHDRPSAERELAALNTVAPGGRLTLVAERDLGSYDGSHTRTLAATEALLEAFPKSAPLLRTRLNILGELQQRAEYRQSISELAKRNDSDPIFWRLWAQELSKDAREFSAAESQFLRILHFRPLDPETLHSLANLRWAERRYEDAARLYRAAALLSDKVEHYWRSWFLAARHLRRSEEVIQILHARVRDVGTRSSEPIHSLFVALSILDRPREAFAILEKGMADRPEDGTLLLFAADQYARHGDRPRAWALLEAARQRAATSAWQRASAMLADLESDLTRARDTWAVIADAEPLAMDAQQNLARLLAETRGRTVALEHLARMCGTFPHHVPLLQLQAEWLRDDGFEVEEAALGMLLQADPENAWARRELALGFIQQGKTEKAFAEMDRAMQIAPHEPATFSVQAFVLRTAGQRELARAASRKAVELSVDFTPGLDELFLCSETFAEKQDALAYVQQELERQVVFGDGLLSYRDQAYRILEPGVLLEHLRKAHHARPDLWHAWSALTAQCTDMNLLDEALSNAREATERFPLLPRIWLDLADVQMRCGDHSGESDALVQALNLSPGWSMAARQLASAQARMGEYQSAIQTLEKAITAAPLEVANHGLLAHLLLRMDKRREGIERLEHAIRLEPNYPAAWNALREAEHPSENLAVSLARELVEKRAGDSRCWLRLAQMLPEEDLDAQLAALDRALALDPRFIDAHDHRALTLCLAGRPEAALAAAQPLTFGAEQPVELRGRRAWIREQHGRRGEAITDLQQVVHDHPDYYWGWQMLTNWLVAERRFSEALTCAETLARLAPRDSIPLGHIAQIHMAMDNGAAARETLRKAFAADPSYEYAGFTLFDSELEQDLEKAEETLALLKKHVPGARVLFAEVQLLCRKGCKAEALEQLRRLCSVEARDSYPLIQATQAVISAGWSVEAERILQAELLNPGASPTTGACWVHTFSAQGKWRRRRRLYKLGVASEIGREAHYAYLGEIGEHRQKRLALSYARRMRKAIQQHTKLWGQLGYALQNCGAHSTTVKLLADWRSHDKVEPWMLNNLALALRILGRDAEAHQVHETALTLRPDHSTDTHRHWVANELACRGDAAGAAQHLAHTKHPAEDRHTESLALLTNAVIATCNAPLTERKQKYREHCAALKCHPLEVACQDNSLRRAVRRNTTQVARLAGLRYPALRALWVTRGEIMRGPGAWVMLTLVALFVINALNSIPASTPEPEADAFPTLSREHAAKSPALPRSAERSAPEATPPPLQSSEEPVKFELESGPSVPDPYGLPKLQSERAVY